ncbi:hypothetical protein [Kitasatospora sp. NBC_00315]|uniref:hypothetical protein n=1 Tax=Kitasatospora sp. NBC_00315 TaxID=2975963 RepID=UPI00324EE353
MKKIAAVAALTMAALGLAAPAHAAGDVLGGAADGLSVSPADLALHQAGALPVVGGPVQDVQAAVPDPGALGGR